MAGKEAALVRAPDTNKFILAQSGRTFLFAHPERKIWRGSVAALRADKRSFIEYHNADPRPLDGPNQPTRFSVRSNASAPTIRPQQTAQTSVTGLPEYRALSTDDGTADIANQPLNIADLKRSGLWRCR
jgi:hypothetical protein